MNSFSPGSVRWLWVVLLPWLLIGCATRKDTSFGHPTVFVPGQPLERVGLALMEAFKEKGYDLQPSTARRLVFDREAGVGQFLLHGDWEGRSVHTRVIVTLEYQSGGERVRAEVRKVRNQGEWMTEETSWSPAAGGEVQKILDAVRASFPEVPGA